MSFFYNLNKTLAAIAGKADASHLNERDLKSTSTSALKAAAGKNAEADKKSGVPANYSTKQVKDELKSRGVEEGNAFSGAVAKAKADGVQPGEKITVGSKQYPVKEEGMSAADKSFAALAEPKDKITFADKIAGAKKEVDEMLGDVAADAMKSAIGKIREIEHDDVEEGFDDMQKDVKKRMADMSKMKTGDRHTGHKHDIEKTATGIRATRRVNPDGMSVGTDDDDSGDGEKRGRGRPKGTGVKMGAKGPSGKSKLMTREDDEYDAEYDDEAGMAKQDLTQAQDAAEELRSILDSDENLPEWVQAKITKAVDYLDTARDYIKSGKKELDEKKDVKRDNKAEKDGKKVTKDIEYDEKKKDGIHGKKRDAEDDKAEKAGKKVAKDVESDEKEEKPKKAKGGINFGGSVYENLDAQLEGLITEGMNVTINMTTDDNGQDRKTVTVTAEDDDAVSLVELLRNAGMGNSAPKSCTTCGESAGCGCDMVEENSPNWPTNQETSNDALQYSGGLNKPKSTGQTTTPVIASQLRRQVSMEESIKLERNLFDLYKNFTK
tara:strand:- start:292 stop:1941 length:1650 start_codon:yes stop_codon:yes gene_type:complete